MHSLLYWTELIVFILAILAVALALTPRAQRHASA